MTKEFEIPEGYEARIEGNKVVIEPKESEYETIRKEIINLVKFALKEGSAVSPGSDVTREQALAYLEKQKEQKPAEWSEEDENFIRELCNLLASIAKNNYVGRYYAPELVSKLQSLRAQPHWKPSKEQIYSLGTVVKGAGENSACSIAYNLNELYEELKKL